MLGPQLQQGCMLMKLTCLLCNKPIVEHGDYDSPFQPSSHSEIPNLSCQMIQEEWDTRYLIFFEGSDQVEHALCVPCKRGNSPVAHSNLPNNCHRTHGHMKDAQAQRTRPNTQCNAWIPENRSELGLSSFHAIAPAPLPERENTQTNLEHIHRYSYPSYFQLADPIQTSGCGETPR